MTLAAQSNYSNYQMRTFVYGLESNYTNSQMRISSQPRAIRA
jgi:hypothetical protein